MAKYEYTMDQLKAAQHPKTGLVAMKMEQSLLPYAAGDIAGFPPEVAQAHGMSGIAQIYSGEGVVTRGEGEEGQSFDPAPVPGAVVNPIQPVRVTPYDGRPEVAPNQQVTKDAANQPTQPVPEVVIPDGWEEWPSNERRKLAANLSGLRYQEISGDEATDIINGEIEKRSPADEGEAA